MDNPVWPQLLILLAILLIFVGPKFKIKNNHRVVGVLLLVGGLWLIATISMAVGSL